MPTELQRCGACGWDIAPMRYPGSNVEIDSDPLSAQVEARLLELGPALVAALSAQQCFACGQWIEASEGRREPCEVCAPAVAALVRGTLSVPLPHRLTPHPLCVHCFVGWLHLWLGVGPEVQT